MGRKKFSGDSLYPLGTNYSAPFGEQQGPPKTKTEADAGGELGSQDLQLAERMNYGKVKGFLTSQLHNVTSGY